MTKLNYLNLFQKIYKLIEFSNLTVPDESIQLLINKAEKNFFNRITQKMMKEFVDFFSLNFETNFFLVEDSFLGNDVKIDGYSFEFLSKNNFNMTLKCKINNSIEIYKIENQYFERQMKEKYLIYEDQLKKEKYIFNFDKDNYFKDFQLKDMENNIRIIKSNESFEKDRKYFNYSINYFKTFEMGYIYEFKELFLPNLNDRTINSNDFLVLIKNKENNISSYVNFEFDLDMVRNFYFADDSDIINIIDFLEVKTLTFKKNENVPSFFNNNFRKKKVLSFFSNDFNKKIYGRNYTFNIDKNNYSLKSDILKILRPFFYIDYKLFDEKFYFKIFEQIKIDYQHSINSFLEKIKKKYKISIINSLEKKYLCQKNNVKNPQKIPLIVSVECHIYENEITKITDKIQDMRKKVNFGENIFHFF
jgi:hypothetical protein